MIVTALMVKAQLTLQIYLMDWLEILDQAGHCAHIDQPELFNRLALDFLAAHINTG
jgi:pimeloyl-ACP methyl ester carboxylesterase